MSLSSIEYFIVKQKKVLNIDNFKKIAKERDKIKAYNEKIDYQNKLLYASLNDIIYCEDISLLEETKEILSKFSLSYNYGENRGLFNEYQSNLEQLKDLFNKKLVEAFKVLDRSIGEIEKKYILEINPKKGYLNSIAKKKKLQLAKKELLKNYSQFNQIKKIVTK